MKEFDFNPFGTKSIVVKFDCDKCDEPVRSEDIFVPSPDFTAERTSDSQVEEDGYAVCVTCGREFDITIYVTFSDASGVIDHLSNQADVEIEEISEGPDEFDWKVPSSEHLKRFRKHLSSVKKLLDQSLDEETKFSLLVMLYAHVVTAMEQFLSSVFIREVTNSAALIRKLVETDPELAKRQFSLNELYRQSDKIKTTVETYLKELIFHNLQKIKPMYKAVLGCDFDNIDWLFRAVSTRHDCVHRAGYEKDGTKLSINQTDVTELMDQCTDLAKKIDRHVNLSTKGET